MRGATGSSRRKTTSEEQVQRGGYGKHKLMGKGSIIGPIRTQTVRRRHENSHGGQNQRTKNKVKVSGGEAS